MRIFGSVKSHETRARAVSFRVIHAHPRLIVRQRDRSIVARIRTGHTAAVPGFRVRLVLNNAIASRRTCVRVGRLRTHPNVSPRDRSPIQPSTASSRPRSRAVRASNGIACTRSQSQISLDVRLAMALCLTYSRVGERDGDGRARGGFEPS
jgi:hypothetical protein